MRALGCWLLVLLLCTSCKWKESRCPHIVQSDVTPVASPPDAAELLGQVAQRYARLRSYSDSGCVSTSFSGKRPPIPGDRQPFELVFARSSTLRLEMMKGTLGVAKQRFALWTESGTIRSWWSVRPKIETHATLSQGLTGVPVSGSVVSVARLLLGRDSFAPWLVRLKNPHLRGVQRLPNGADCYVIAGDTNIGQVELWVERTTLAIHRTHERFTLSSGRQVDTTTIHRPRLEEPIDPASARFAPPRTTNFLGIGDKSRDLVCRCD
jgi:hypothetical protein